MQLLGLPDLDHVLEHASAIADDGDVDADVLVDRGPVDVDVDLLGIGRKGREPAGHPVVEPGADIDHHVAVMHRHVGLVHAMHSHHAQKLRVGSRKGAEAHEGQRAGIAGEPDELAKELGGARPGIDHAAAAIEQRALGLGHQLDRRLDQLRVALELGVVALVLDRRAAAVLVLGLEDVLRQVDDDRSGPAAARDIEGLVDRAGEVGDVLHQVIVLGAGPRDPGGVGLLEGVVADQMGRHLAGEADDGNRIHQRVGQAGDGIGGAGARGDKDHAHLAGGARIAFRRMDGCLLMAHEDMAQRVLLEQLVVERQHSPARIAENHIHALIQQGLDDDSGSVRFLGRHGPMLLRIWSKTLIVNEGENCGNSPATAGS